MPDANPLTESDCDCLDAVLTKMAEARQIVAKCKNCGFDTAKSEQEIEDIVATATAMKAQFFPDRK